MIRNWPVGLCPPPSRRRAGAVCCGATAPACHSLGAFIMFISIPAPIRAVYDFCVEHRVAAAIIAAQAAAIALLLAR